MEVCAGSGAMDGQCVRRKALLRVCRLEREIPLLFLIALRGGLLVVCTYGLALSSW